MASDDTRAAVHAITTFSNVLPKLQGIFCAALEPSGRLANHAGLAASCRRKYSLAESAIVTKAAPIMMTSFTTSLPRPLR